MISNQEIKNLIECPKQIYKRDPKNKYREERGQKKADLFLHSEKNIPCLLKKLNTQETENLDQSPILKKLNFKIFIRQNQNFIENFSIGLVYSFLDFPKALNIIRYNGPHDSVRAEDNKRKGEHHPLPHIHTMTEEDINSGSSNPKPIKLEITNKYILLKKGFYLFLQI